MQLMDCLINENNVKVVQCDFEMLNKYRYFLDDDSVLYHNLNFNCCLEMNSSLETSVVVNLIICLNRTWRAFL